MVLTTCCGARRANETYTSILHFILSQSAAAAQVCRGGPCWAGPATVARGCSFVSACPRELCMTATVCATSLQATALAFGANHTAALMLPGKDGKAGHHSLYTTGRGAQRTLCTLCADALTCHWPA